MWRVLVFLGLLCLAAYGAVWLSNNPETIAVTWAGNEYSLPLAVGVVGLVAAAILLALLLGAFSTVLTLPTRLRRRSRRRRQEKGYAAITRGIVAVGAGDVAAARRHAGEAQRLMGHEPLALLLKAQAAQASGQREAADAAFREMAERPETRVLGLRGLYLEARRRGDDPSAREHAEEAARLAPAIGWASDAVLEGLSAEGDWAGAVRTIERRSSLGLVDRETARRQRAVLLAADAQAREGRDPDGALAAAEQAVKLAPGLVPAAVLAGRLLSARGDLKRAARIIESAWTADPHPDLAGAYLNLRPGDSGMDRLRRAETLAKLSSWSNEARFAIARAAIEARELPRAREVLRPILDEDTRPTVRLCMAMAEIEGRSGQAGPAREWLARAARARRDKAWIADGVVSDRWAPVSPVTGRLDAFVWDTPPEALGSQAETHSGIFEPDPAEPKDELPAFLNRNLPAPAAPGPKADAAPVPEPEPEPVAAVTDAKIVPTPVEPAAPAAPAAAPAPSVMTPGPSAMAAGLVDPKAGPGPKTGPAPSPADTASPQGAPPAAAPEGPGPTRESAVVAAASSPVGRRAEANGSAAPARAAPEPAPVVFPVRRAPDDPGLEGEEDRRQRFRLRV